MKKKNKKRKKKSGSTWETPITPKNDAEIQVQLSKIISFTNIVKGTCKPKKYEIAYEYATRVAELIDAVLTAMEELPPEKK